MRLRSHYIQYDIYVDDIIDDIYLIRAIVAATARDSMKSQQRSNIVWFGEIYSISTFDLILHCIIIGNGYSSSSLRNVLFTIIRMKL